MTKEDILLKLNRVVMPDENSSEGINDHRGPSKLDNAKLSNIAKMAEDIDKDHFLAKELWETQWPAAQLLSFLTEQPEKVTEMQLDNQIRSISTAQLIDIYCRSVVFESPYVNAKIEEWCRSEVELVKRAGYILLNLKAKKGNDFTDGDFTVFLDRIEDEIKTEKDMVKEAMYYALIAIGRRNRFLNQKALEAADKISEIHFRSSPPQKLADARVVLQQDNTFTSLNGSGNH